MSDDQEGENGSVVGEFQVERVVNYRVTTAGVTQYLVRWVGYEEKTWVNIKDIAADEAVAEFWRNAPPNYALAEAAPNPAPATQSPAPQRRPSRGKKARKTMNGTPVRRGDPRLVSESYHSSPVSDADDEEAPRPVSRRRFPVPLDSDDEEQANALSSKEATAASSKASPDEATPTPGTHQNEFFAPGATPAPGQFEITNTSPKDVPAIATSKSPSPPAHLDQVFVSEPAYEPPVMEEGEVFRLSSTPEETSLQDHPMTTTPEPEEEEESTSEDGYHDALFDRPASPSRPQNIDDSEKGYVFDPNALDAVLTLLTTTRFGFKTGRHRSMTDLSSVSARTSATLSSILEHWDPPSIFHFPNPNSSDEPLTASERLSSFTEDVKDKKVFIFTPKAMPKLNRTIDNDARLDAVALYFLLSQYGATPVQDPSTTGISHVFIHVSERNSLHTFRAFDALRMQVQPCIPSFFLFGLEKPTSLNKSAQDIFKRTWDDGIAVTFSNEAIMNSPEVALRIMKKARAAYPYISIFLHCGVVANGGILGLEHKGCFPPLDDPSRRSIFGLLRGHVLESTKIELISPIAVMSAQKGTPKTVTHEYFPVRSDIVQAHELHLYDYWAPGILETGGLDAILDLLHALQSKYTSKRRWVAVVDRKEKQLNRKKDLYGVEVLDINSFYRSRISKLRE